MVDTRTLAVAWQRRTPRNDGSLRWRRLIYRPDATGFVDYVVGVSRLRPTPAPEPQRRGLARRVPHFLLLEAATAARRVDWQGERTLDGESHDVVSVELADTVPLILVVSRRPALLRRVEYRRHLPTRGDVRVGFEWSDWRTDPGLGWVPSRARIDVDGVTYQEVRYSRFVGASADVERLLDAERGLAPMPGASASSAAPPLDPALPRTGEVAPGVHVVDASGFTVMFVEFRDFVAAFEAPHVHAGLEAIPSGAPAANATLELLAQIRKTAPAKPLRYVVISHHHSDHMGGLRSFAAEGAMLIVAPGHRTAAASCLDLPHTLAPDAWTGSSLTAHLETVSGTRTLTDGVRRMEVISVGRNPHTSESLMVWLPEERLVFQGDLFYYSEGGAFPPSGRGTMNRFFARWLRERGLLPRAVYGVHSDPAGPELLRLAAP